MKKILMGALTCVAICTSALFAEAAYDSFYQNLTSSIFLEDVIAKAGPEDIEVYDPNIFFKSQLIKNCIIPSCHLFGDNDYEYGEKIDCSPLTSGLSHWCVIIPCKQKI